MKISVCVPTTRPATLGATVDSIVAQTWTDWELIVVGQGADEDLRRVGAALPARDPRVRYLHLERRGLSLARNAAVRAAGGEVVAFIDDDCEARSDWLAALAEGFAADPSVGLIGGQVVPPARRGRGPAICPGCGPSESLYDPIASQRQPPPGWDWIGANVAIRRTVLAEAGEFDELLGAGATFPAGEDTDYKLRLERMGVRMRATPRSVVYHTYGYRYGWRAVLRNARNYATGNGALAGKLTLQGDPRGQEWVTLALKACTVDRLRRPRPQRLPADLLRFWHVAQAYRRCLRGYTVDRQRHVLRRFRPDPAPLPG